MSLILSGVAFIESAKEILHLINNLVPSKRERLRDEYHDVITHLENEANASFPRYNDDGKALAKERVEAFKEAYGAILQEEQ